MSETEMKELLSNYEAMDTTLDATDQYRVLRRLASQPVIEPYDGSVTRLGLFVDVETTGLDPARDEIVELAMVPFSYGVDGRIFNVHQAFEKLREPSQPLSAKITALTGITNDMVAGKVIDPADVAAFVNRADLVVAHNAKFDRRFVERFCDACAHKPWACSMSQIDWAEEGFEGTKLGYLAMGVGFFYDRHRAANDCLAAIELLATPLPTLAGWRWIACSKRLAGRAGVSGLKTLRSNSRMSSRPVAIAGMETAVQVPRPGTSTSTTIPKSKSSGSCEAKSISVTSNSWFAESPHLRDSPTGSSVTGPTSCSAASR